MTGQDWESGREQIGFILSTQAARHLGFSLDHVGTGDIGGPRFDLAQKLQQRHRANPKSDRRGSASCACMEGAANRKESDTICPRSSWALAAKRTEAAGNGEPAGASAGCLPYNRGNENNGRRQCQA
jgi:hypothetical protein